MGQGRISRESSTPPTQGGGAQTQPNFGGSLLFIIHPLTQNYQIIKIRQKVTVISMCASEKQIKELRIYTFVQKSSLERIVAKSGIWVGPWT